MGFILGHSLHELFDHIVWFYVLQNQGEISHSMLQGRGIGRSNFILERWKMIKVFFNIIKLIFVLRERGNWKLIRHSQKQLINFIFCRTGLNRMSPIRAIFNWYYFLKGPEVLIWRLETFGFLFPSDLDQKARDHLNSYLWDFGCFKFFYLRRTSSELANYFLLYIS